MIPQMKSAITDSEHFYAEGIPIKDVRPVFFKPRLFALAVRDLALRVHPNVQKIVGLKHGGFILGSAVAYEIGVGFVPLFVDGGKTIVDIHKDAIKPAESVALVSGVLASGEFELEAIKIIQDCGGVIDRCLFLAEMIDLGARKKLSGVPVESIVKF